MIIKTKSREETFALGRAMGRTADPGEVIALTGDLGAGKTTFTQGFAAGLGITEPVTSPTFTILAVYEGGRLPLCHFDIYRIEEPEEMDEIGYEDAFYGDGVSIVEWADVVPEIFPENTVRIEIRRCAEGDDVRLIRISPDSALPPEAAPSLT